jgi:hypothetical protein
MHITEVRESNKMKEKKRQREREKEHTVLRMKVISHLKRQRPVRTAVQGCCTYSTTLSRTRSISSFLFFLCIFVHKMENIRLRHIDSLCRRLLLITFVYFRERKGGRRRRRREEHRRQYLFLNTHHYAMVEKQEKKKIPASTINSRNSIVEP